MAQGCDDPNCYANHHGMSGMKAKVRRDIKAVGWSVVGILGTPSFSYTVGMTTKKLPELYFPLDVRGTPDTLNRAARLLNAVGHDIVTNNRKPHHGMTISIANPGSEDWTVYFETRLHTTPLGMAREMYGNRFRVLEVDILD